MTAGRRSILRILAAEYAVTSCGPRFRSHAELVRGVCAVEMVRQVVVSGAGWPMRRRPVLEVELNGYASVIRAIGTREHRDLIEAITGRPPVWVFKAKGYAVQEKTARDVITGPLVAGTGGGA